MGVTALTTTYESRVYHLAIQGSIMGDRAEIVGCDLGVLSPDRIAEHAEYDAYISKTAGLIH